MLQGQLHSTHGEIPSRVMSLLNLGLQRVGLMRAEMPEEYESAVRSCGNLGELRKAKSSPSYEAALSDSLAGADPGGVFGVSRPPLHPSDH